MRKGLFTSSFLHGPPVRNGDGLQNFSAADVLLYSTALSATSGPRFFSFGGGGCCWLSEPFHYCLNEREEKEADWKRPACLEDENELHQAASAA